MLKTILKVTGDKEVPAKKVKVTEGDLSRIGSEKFRRVEFVKIPAIADNKAITFDTVLNKS